MNTLFTAVFAVFLIGLAFVIAVLLFVWFMGK